MLEGMKRRFGIFFTLLGAVLLALFFTSDVIQQPNLLYLISGLVSGAIGITFLRASRPEPQESGRFRLLRRSRTKKEKKINEKNGKHEKTE
jgi:hypothetical protein